MAIISQDKEKLRTGVEDLMLSEMVEEDAHFLIMGDDDIEPIIPDNFNSGDGLFGDSTSGTLDTDDDEDIFDDTLF